MVSSFNPFTWRPPMLVMPRRFYSRYVVYAAAFCLALFTLYCLRFQDQLRLGAPTVERPWKAPSQWSDRAFQIRSSFLHAYRGYEMHAAPRDELKPLSNGSTNTFNGWGITVVDALDTMLLMGLNDEFRRGIAIVEQVNLTQPHNPSVPFFETVIRYLGGLLSAYALSHESILLEKADELANFLDPVFNTTSGFPAYAVNFQTGQSIRNEFGILAEIGTFQLEYAYLAKLTGNKTQFHRANNAIAKLLEADTHNTGGLLPIGWNLSSGQPYDTRLSVGAEADSGHEYLLKYYLLTAKTDKRSLELYIRATTHILTKLLYVTSQRHLLYATTTYGVPPTPTHVFEHLSCFLPGLLALGAHTLPLDNLRSLGIDLIKLSEGMNEDSAKGYKILAQYNLRQLHMWAAEGLTDTCYLTYADQASGMGPDELWMVSTAEGTWIEAVERWKKSGARGSPPGLGLKAPVKFDATTHILTGEETMFNAQRAAQDYSFNRKDYLLRPETVESLYLMWRITGEDRWRDHGWEIFQALETQAKTPSGYASLRHVDLSPATQLDEMPSYFLAETLKYLFLLFTDDDLLPLTKWVFNTEAHPFPVFQWSAKERKAFGI